MQTHTSSFVYKQFLTVAYIVFHLFTFLAAEKNSISYKCIKNVYLNIFKYTSALSSSWELSDKHYAHNHSLYNTYLVMFINKPI